MSDFMMFFHEFGCVDVFFVPDSTSKNKVQVIFLCVCFFAYKIVTAHIRLRLVHSEKKEVWSDFFSSYGLFLCPSPSSRPGTEIKY